MPELVAEFPFLLLNPAELARCGIPFEEVMYADGAMAWGRRVDFTDMAPMGICVDGSVAVADHGGRTG